MAISQWNSVFLFFNLPSSIRPSGYSNTGPQDVLNFLDLGLNPAPIKISDFMCNYWDTLSYGQLRFGIDTPKNSSGNVIIPTLTPKDNDHMDWGDIIDQYLDSYAVEVWVAAGRKTKSKYRFAPHIRTRWIPSIVLVQNYHHVNQSGGFSGYNRRVDGIEYIIGDVIHIEYNLQKTNPIDFPGLVQHGRRYWKTLAHEYGHNFLETHDLYHPQGTTGYWDLLGDNSYPGKMSEVSSVFKERVGWLTFKQVIYGTRFPRTNLSLRPYTTTGEAIKIIPDPVHNPHEFFILEYRKSTGNELWRPDGGLTEEGLLITHFNTRLDFAPVWLMREAPYFDPEFADFSDSGAALFTGHDRLEGVLFPQGSNDSFTKSSQPSSDFYGKRESGLSIENIRVSRGECYFSVSINIESYAGWSVSLRDRAVAGKFHGRNQPHTIFIRNDDRAYLLRMIESQWFAVHSASNWIGDWELKEGDKDPLVGDFDGNGNQELYFRDSNRAGIIEFNTGGWGSQTVQSGQIDSWRLGRNDWETIANVDGDNQDEIVIRSAKWIGLIKLISTGGGQRLKLLYIKRETVGSWTLNDKDGIYGGYFRDTQKQDILITASNDIGLISWNPDSEKFELVIKHHDRIDGWNIGSRNRFCIGDFDGDGFDEIYVRSRKWAGLIKWQRDRFKLIWIKKDFVEHFDGTDENIMPFSNLDKSYKGKFLPDRDCILHRSNDEICIFAWDGTDMKVRQALKSSFGGKWGLSRKDKFVLGDFHTLTPDIGNPSLDYIGNGISDIFIHNDWGTGMVGVNYTEWNPARHPNQIKEEIGLTWIQERIILKDG